MPRNTRSLLKELKEFSVFRNLKNSEDVKSAFVLLGTILTSILVGAGLGYTADKAETNNILPESASTPLNDQTERPDLSDLLQIQDSYLGDGNNGNNKTLNGELNESEDSNLDQESAGRSTGGVLTAPPKHR